MKNLTEPGLLLANLVQSGSPLCLTLPVNLSAGVRLLCAAGVGPLMVACRFLFVDGAKKPSHVSAPMLQCCLPGFVVCFKVFMVFFSSPSHLVVFPVSPLSL